MIHSVYQFNNLLTTWDDVLMFSTYFLTTIIDFLIWKIGIFSNFASFLFKVNRYAFLLLITFFNSAINN